MINRVILVGNLTRDADPVSTTGKAMTRIRLATNAQWKDANGERREESEYHSVVCFGRLAEVCATYCSRGARVYVEGRLRTRDYESADGLKRTATEIVADTVKFLQTRGPGGTDPAEERHEGAAPVEVGAG